VQKVLDPLAWYPHNVIDWLTSETVRAMSNAAKGVYLDLLCRQWRDGSIPSDVAKLARLCNEPLDVFADLWEEVWPNFTETESGRLVNLRMERDRTEQDQARIAKSEAGKKGMASRWSKRIETKPAPKDNTVITPLSDCNNRCVTGDNEKEKEKEKEILVTSTDKAPSTEIPPASEVPPPAKAVGGRSDFWDLAGKHSDPLVRALCKSAWHVPKFRQHPPSDIRLVERLIASLREKAPNDRVIQDEICKFEAYWTATQHPKGAGVWTSKFANWCGKCFGTWATAKPTTATITSGVKAWTAEDLARMGDDDV